MDKNPRLKVVTLRTYGVVDENGDQVSPDFGMRYEAVNWKKEKEVHGK